MSHLLPSRPPPPKSRQPAPGSSEYSRKDKSLGLLCENFVQEYGRIENHIISLDGAAETLGVERRRIYDIVNVLESVGIVARQAKNCYAWRGFNQIHHKLADLQVKANSDLYGGPDDFRAPPSNRIIPNNSDPHSNPPTLKQPHRVPPPPPPAGHQASSPPQSNSQSQPDPSDMYMSSSIETEPDAPDHYSHSHHSQHPHQQSYQSSLQPLPQHHYRNSMGPQGTQHGHAHGPGAGPAASTASTVGRPTSRKEKSLGVLSQRFVQLFLMAGQTAVSLESAAVQLLGRSPSDSEPLSLNSSDGEASKLLKTKVRRLYDIANILTSLNLIEKVHTVNRKPAFKWLGPDSCCATMREFRDHYPNGSTKRPMSVSIVDERIRAAAKRRKTIPGPGYGSGSEGTGVGSTGFDQSDCYDQVEPGFDPETMRKINCVIASFPESYAKRWRDYVASVNGMMMRGHVSREKAYDSISNVVKQYRGGDDHYGNGHGPGNSHMHGSSGTKVVPKMEHGISNRNMDPHFEMANKVSGSNPNGHGHGQANSHMHGPACPKNEPDLVPSRCNRKMESETAKKVIGASSHSGASRSAGGSHDGNEAKRGRDSNVDSEEEYDEEMEAERDMSGMSDGSAIANGDKQSALNDKSGVEKKQCGTGEKKCCSPGEGEGDDQEQGDDRTDGNDGEDGDDQEDGEEKEPRVDKGNSDQEDDENDGKNNKSMNSNKGSKGSRAGPPGMKWTEDNIELYMQRAEAAGPEYARAAQQWLKELRGWQKLWAKSFSALQSMPNMSKLGNLRKSEL